MNSNESMHSDEEPMEIDESGADSSQSAANEQQLEEDKELTKKFLRGELTFTEYSSQWRNTGNDEHDLSESDDDKPCAKTPVNKTKTQPENKVVKKKLTRKHTHLSPALLGLMGEANLRYVRGEKELAEKMCHEIIRQVPNAAEPYHTLAQIYDADPEKSLQFTLLAAHLNPSDAEEWMRLAGVARQRQDVKLEMLCYSKAVSARPQHLPFHLKRIELINTLIENKVPFHLLNLSLQKCYTRIVTSVPPSETTLQYAKMAATLYHSEGDIVKALEVMDIAYYKCDHLFSVEDLNLYLELLIAEHKYDTCLEVLVSKAGVEIEAEVKTMADGEDLSEETHIIDCTMPSTLPIDLKTKLMVCLIHLHAYRIVKDLMNSLLENDVEIAGDLYLDSEEALTSEGNHEMALQMLEPLVHSKKFSLGAVWLKHAQCLHALGRTDEAIKSYQMVIKLAPQHLDARRNLCNILKAKGRIDEALDALEQNLQDTLDVNLMYEHCLMLKDSQKLEKYLEVGRILLSRHFVPIRNRHEIVVSRLRDVHDTLKQDRTERGEKLIDDDLPQFDESTNKLTVAMEWELFNDLLETAFPYRNYPILQRMAFSSYGSKKFSQYRSQIDFLCLLFAILNGDFFHGYNVIRDILVQKHVDKPQNWNFFNIVIQYTEDNRHIKFLTRFLQKRTDYDINLELLVGNNFLASGRYKSALRQYVKTYKTIEDPLCALLMAITMLYISSQKNVDKHHSLIMQSIALLFTYKKYRGCGGEEEAYYNIARAYHNLSLYNLAIHYYNKVLETPCVIRCLHSEDHTNFLQLKPHAAFNLHLIYKNTSPQLARMYLNKYIVI